MKGGGKKGKDKGKDKGKCKGKNKDDGKGKHNDGKGKHKDCKNQVGGVGHPPRRRLGRLPLRVRSASSACTRCGCVLRLVRPARASRRV